MSHNPFDDRIKKTFEGYKAPLNQDAWSRMQERMNEDPDLAESTQEEKAFDAAVREKIGHTEYPMKSHHWSIMAKRIRKEFSLREKLVRFKIAEITLMLLAIFTFTQYFPVYKQSGMFQRVNEYFQKEILNLSKNRIARDNQDTPATVDLHSKTNHTPIVGIVQAADADQTSTAKAYWTLYEYAEKLNQSGRTALQQTDHSATLPSQLPHKSVRKVMSEEGISTDEKARQDFPIKPARLLAMNSVIPQANKAINTPALEKVDDPSGIRISMFSSFDYNYIKTPYDLLFETEEFGRYAPGYGGGISFGFKFGNWEIETGGIYSSKEYEPNSVKERIRVGASNMYTWATFKNIQLNMLEVPINLRYDFAKIKRWRLYGQTGASLHLAMQANYDRYPTTLGRVQSQTDEGTVPKLVKKRYPDGLMEGGNFEENSYYTANLGLGIEHLLNTRWSLFMQPGVQAYLAPNYNNGIGPNQDRISSISILTGARVSLW